MKYYDEGAWVKSCEGMYDRFLNSQLVCFNPYEKNDDEVLEEIKRRSLVTSGLNYLEESENFCAVFNVVGTEDMAQWGYSGEGFVLSPVGDVYDSQRLTIEEWHFKNYIHVDTGEDFKFNGNHESKRYSKIEKISTINGISNLRLYNNVLYLFDYYIPGRTSSMKFRNAYRFFRLPAKDELPDFYRKHLTITKAFVLKYIIAHPKISHPYYKPDLLINNKHMILLEELFTKQYKQKFEEILCDTLEVLANKHIPNPEII